MLQRQAAKPNLSHQPGVARDRQHVTAPVSEHARWPQLEGGIGNQAATRLLQRRAAVMDGAGVTFPQSATAGANLVLQRKCGCGGTPVGLSGECEECSKKNAGPQTKLRISEPGDIYEQEADRIADQVMAASGRLDNPALPIQRVPTASGAQWEATAAGVKGTLAGSGRPLEPELRQEMEQGFGQDFSSVRVHSGVTADRSARELNANAYTIGRDIVFATGQYAPHTAQGRRLIAHELTHVVQQGPSASHSGLRSSIQRQPLEVLRPPVPVPVPVPAPAPVPVPEVPEIGPLPPAVPEPRRAPRRGRLKPGACGSPDLPLTLVSFFPGRLGQGGSVKASPLTRCPGNTIGSKPLDSIYKEQFKCIEDAGEKGNWVRGHILHGETDKSGPRNLHGPGYTARNLIIVDQSLNQKMWSWIENVVLNLVYGPYPHVLWLRAGVDSYYPGLEFFADSISIEYGRFDTDSGTEGPRLNGGQFVREKKPPHCPSAVYLGTPVGGLTPGTLSAWFQSTLQICHRQLESRVFNVAYGGLMVAINATWVGRGPGAEAAGAEGQPEGCPTQNYHVALWKDETLAFDQWISTFRELSTRRRVVLTWRELDEGDYYLKILTENLDPYCCLEGDITVLPFVAPGPKSLPPPEIA
jgi:hypothetical protein